MNSHNLPKIYNRILLTGLRDGRAKAINELEMIVRDLKEKGIGQNDAAKVDAWEQLLRCNLNLCEGLDIREAVEELEKVVSNESISEKDKKSSILLTFAALRDHPMKIAADEMRAIVQRISFAYPELSDEDVVAIIQEVEALELPSV